MTAPVAADPQEQRSGSGRPRERGTWLRILAFAVTAIVAGAVGVAGTLLQQRIDAADTSAVDAQAAAITADLRADLNAGFYSGGGTYGGRFTEGTLVAQVQAHGGVVLGARTERDRTAGDVHTAEVMLGLVPPLTGTVDARAYPVRCYRYAFGVGAYSVKRSGMTCPATRTDGSPGSLAAQMGVLLTRQPAGAFAYRPVPTQGYAHTPQGAEDFLKDRRLVTADDTVSAVSGEADGDGVYVLALRIDGACHYLRMDSSSTASRLVPLWAAPADEQEVCGVRQAVAAAALYGTDPAQQG
ncbi:hypothetical protein [Streptomyces sp. NPDC001068]|uniref:hypothetical protein n=1 Tax=Streptomyces sp. NPDC001068 TaxID=3364544 RepID=UPI0036CC630D